MSTTRASNTGAEGAARGGAFARFFRSEASGSVLLLAATVLALVWANSPWANAYQSLLHAEAGASWAGVPHTLSLQHWVNDGLMVLFFFVVGLEIKRELVIGQLSSLRGALLPVAAALGGMLVPAGLYLLLNHGGPGARGWGVPMATDIAFALGVLALLGPRVPVGLKVFLTALAIADDLGAVLVIALFYTQELDLSALGLAGALLAVAFLMSRLGVRRLAVYLPVVVGVWLATRASGVHATVAGILVAMAVPVRGRLEPGRFLEIARDRLSELESAGLTRDSPVRDRRQLETVVDLRDAADRFMPPGLAFEHALHPVTAWFVLPLFALFNAGVALDGGLSATLSSPVSLGILLGLFLGKQLGVWLACWLAVKTGRAELPAGVTFSHIWGASVLAGIGFTMSIFVAGLAFPDEALLGAAKLGILVASTLAGVAGYLALRIALRRRVHPT
jgi:NhaA family Na+:H+ antiporter